MNPEAYRHELHLRSLPERARDILLHLSAPPRLYAHHILVCDTAIQIVDGLQKVGIAQGIRPETISLGAALHDIGKTRYPEELSGYGHNHEQAGQQLLLELGLESTIARIALTHAQWNTHLDVALDDVLVALADICWKGKRNDELEQRIAQMLAAQNQRSF